MYVAGAIRQAVPTQSPARAPQRRAWQILHAASLTRISKPSLLIILRHHMASYGHHHMASYGILWHHMAYYGILWHPMTAYDILILRHPTGICYGILWHPMVSYDVASSISNDVCQPYLSIVVVVEVACFTSRGELHGLRHAVRGRETSGTGGRVTPSNGVQNRRHT